MSAHNKVLHRTAIPLRSIAAGELMLCHMASTCKIEGNIPMKAGGCHDTTTGTKIPESFDRKDT